MTPRPVVVLHLAMYAFLLVALFGGDPDRVLTGFSRFLTALGIGLN
jgi:hypothetical protein